MSGTIFFTSARNYLRRDPSSGMTNMAAPATPAYSYYSIYTTNLVVNHNLGYIPVFRIYYEPFKDGIVWPSLGRFSGKNPLNPSISGPGLTAWPTSTTLNIQLSYSNNTLTGSYPVYWVIYRDVQL